MNLSLLYSNLYLESKLCASFAFMRNVKLIVVTKLQRRDVLFENLENELDS